MYFNNGFTWRRWLVLFLLIVSVTAADGSELSVNRIFQIIMGIIMIVLGSLFVISGSHLISLFLFCCGFSLFGLLSFLTVNHFVSLEEASSIQWYMIYVFVFLVGLIGGIISCCFPKVGLMILGGTLGACLSLLIIRTGLIEDNSTQLILMTSMALAFALLNFISGSPLYSLTTSLYGATIFMSGVDIFIDAGFINFLLGMNSMSTPSIKIWATFAAIIFLTCFGMFIQPRILRFKKSRTREQIP